MKSNAIFTLTKKLRLARWSSKASRLLFIVGGGWGKGVLNFKGKDYYVAIMAPSGAILIDD